jgi:hypothetical protein
MGKKILYGCCAAMAIVVMILLIIVFAREGLATAAPMEQVGPAIVALEAGGASKGVDPAMLAKRLELENTGFYGSCINPGDLFSCQVNCDGNNTYAISEFGGPGLTYADYVKTQAVDPKILENQAKFVADRNRNPSGNITGRVWSPDRHTSYDPIPWVGFRRPQVVSQCNPTQVPDIDLTRYETRPSFTWQSTGNSSD